MTYKNLRFYDNDSNDLNLIYNDELDIWQGVVYLPLVSAGLYETLTLHVLENVEGPLFEDLYVTPIAESIGDVAFKFKFEKDYNSSEDVFLYSAQSDNGELIVKKDLFQSEPILSSTTSTSTSGDKKVVTANLQAKPITCRVALNSEEEGFHIKPLSIVEVVDGVETREIANIKIYGEVEAEDERLKTLLTNIGMNLGDLDYFIFRDSNISEQSPDHILLNQKRKELLLQASSIKPFIGTYKALLRAIDFFGYDKITLKEYWLNINEQSENFGKLKAVAVPNQEVTGFLADKNKTTDLPNSNQKKTSRFSLVYRLNNATGELDQWDIPKVKEALDYSPDEVLVKLYGLKNKLQKDYLPLQAKIVDITGEGDYFSQFNQNVWNNQHNIKDQNAGIEFVPEKVPALRNVYIEDLRKVDYRLTGFNQDFNSIPASDKLEICESIETFYRNYYDLSKDTFNTLDGIPIGAPVSFHVERGLEDSWDFAEFTWEDATDTGNHLLTWENWWHRGVYEIEWHLLGPRGYDKSFRGPVYEWNHFPMTLPYAGKYTVEAHLHDLYNVRSTRIHKEWIEVLNKNVEVYGLTQRATKKLNWNEYTYQWNKTGSSWDWSRENLMPVSDTISTLYLTMDRANYMSDDKDNGTPHSTVRRYIDPNQATGFNETPGPYQWGDLETQTWEDGPETTWKMTRIGSDINSSFQIKIANSDGYSQGTDLVIEQTAGFGTINTDSYAIQSTYPSDAADVLAWEAVADELNNVDPLIYPIISKFNYNAILVDTDGNLVTGNGSLGQDVCPYILAVGKEPARTHDFKTVSFSNPIGGLIDQKINFASYNPGFDDTYIINNLAELNLLNHVTFSYDLTNMPGVVKSEWKLVNNTLNIEDIYYSNQRLTYLLKHKGYYTINLDLTDSNGNKNSITKNILKII